MDIWQELEIAPTDDRGEILRAYAKRLSKVRPEEDPEGAERLRLAYEAALSGAYESLPPPSVEGPSREERLEASRRAAEERAAAAAAAPVLPEVPQPLSAAEPLAGDPLEPLMEPAAAVNKADDWAALSTPSLDAPGAGLGGDTGADEALELWSETAAGSGALPMEPESGAGGYSSDPLAGDPLAPDPLAAAPLAADPLAADPLADPLMADPLAADPLMTDPAADEPLAPAPQTEYPLQDESLAAEPLELVDTPVTPVDRPASAGSESARGRVTLGDLNLASPDRVPDLHSDASATEHLAEPTLSDLAEETAADDGDSLTAARERRRSTIHADRRPAPKRSAWRSRFSWAEPLLALWDKLRGFLTSNKYAEFAVLVVVLIAFGLAAFYGSPFDLIGAAVALICLSGLMRPGSGLLLLFGTLASWLGSIVLIRQGTLPEIDRATLFMLVLLMVFGMIKLADRLEERAASRAGR